jgi:integrase/recombinase XerD
MTQAVMPLRRRMIDDVKIRNLSAGTQGIYVRAVANFSAFHGRSPEELSHKDVRDYQLHLIDRGLKATAIRQILNALRLFSGATLSKPDATQHIPLPRRSDPLLAILSRQRVALLLRSISNPRCTRSSLCLTSQACASAKLSRSPLATPTATA